MGCCASDELPATDKKQIREAKLISNWWDDYLKQEEKKTKSTIKLLFLGAGESGKSTLLKQMTIIHGKGFSDEEKRDYIPLIHSNILNSMKTLIKQSSEFLQADPAAQIYSISPPNTAGKQFILEMKFDEKLTDKSANYIVSLWRDDAIQATYAKKSAYQLSDSAAYFFGRLPAVMQPGYLPDEQDILRARIRTTGIVEHKFEIEQNEFRMFDVGGQRNARKKWIHCFEGVTSVIFVAALSGYDEYLYEDPNTLRLHEDLNLFEDICHSAWFKDTSMILFLNKKDIFKEKIKKVPLTVCFPYYNGPSDYRSGLRFIKEEFKARNVENKALFTHFTCATDTGNVRRVFHFVKATVLRAHLVEIGLLDSTVNMNQGNGSDLLNAEEASDVDEEFKEEEKSTNM